MVFLEPKARYWAKEEGELTTDGPGIGEGRVVRDGDACVVFAYGAMVARCLEAAETCWKPKDSPFASSTFARSRRWTST